MGSSSIRKCLIVVVVMLMVVSVVSLVHDYGDALTKSILFFEGQRSGKLPPNQRMTWRKDSALKDGVAFGIDLTGGYYDAGDNVKYNFPMAFSVTMLAWSVIEFGQYMPSSDVQYALDAIKWGTDYLMKSTSVPEFIVAQVGDPWSDHLCWQRPEDMDTSRAPFVVSKQFPGSEVSAEIAAALAASSIVFKTVNPAYSSQLLLRSNEVFKFANTYQGNYNDNLKPWVCPFYCDWAGFKDELVWAAAWLTKATKSRHYKKYIIETVNSMKTKTNGGGSFAEFGWDTKDAGTNVLLSKMSISGVNDMSSFVADADRLVCSILPESPTKFVTYSRGGMMFKEGGSNMQHSTSLSFLLLVYASYLEKTPAKGVQCGNVFASTARIVQVAKGQVDYILGSNPLGMSYMVGYGNKFPQRIHHRGASMPSMAQHPQHMQCHEGNPYITSSQPNPNQLTGALVGGPDINDQYVDNRLNVTQSEPTTYINAPFVGVLAYFRGHPN